MQGHLTQFIHVTSCTFISFIQQPDQEVYSVVKLKENSLPKDCPLKSLQSRKLIKNFLLLGSGPSLNPGVYKDTLPEHKTRRSRVVVRNKELESEVVIVVLIFHSVKVNVNNNNYYDYHNYSGENFAESQSLKISFHRCGRSCLSYTVQLCLFRGFNFCSLSISTKTGPLENFPLYSNSNLVNIKPHPATRYASPVSTEKV